MENELNVKTQINTILSAMFDNMDKWFIASDFQSGKYFVGYEASARMSDLKRMYPDLFEVKKIDRFRAMKINKNQIDLIEQIKTKIEIEKEMK